MNGRNLKSLVFLFVLFTFFSTNAYGANLKNIAPDNEDVKINNLSNIKTEQNKLSFGLGLPWKKSKTPDATAADSANQKNQQDGQTDESKPRPDVLKESTEPAPDAQAQPWSQQLSQPQSQEIPSSEESPSSQIASPSPTVQNEEPQEETSIPPSLETPSSPSQPPTQTPTQANEDDKQQPDNGKTKEIVKNVLDNPNNKLGISYAQTVLDQCTEMIKNQNFIEARKLAESTQKWLTDVTEMHIDLYKTLKNVSHAKTQAQLEKELALRFALLRDKANYQLGVIYATQNEFIKAAKYLTDVVKSQPRTDLGIKAYEILQTIGFTEKVMLDIQ